MITDAFLEEVSVLIALKPAEPLAEVVLVKRESEPVARRRVRAEPAAREIGRRRFDGDLIIDMSDGTQEISSSGRTVTRYYETPITIR